jgi:hypothetical protein
VSLDIQDDRHPVDVTLSAGRMWVGCRTTAEAFTSWVEELRAEPSREVPTDTGTIRASVLLERYIDAGAVTHVTPEATLAALFSYGWERRG